MTQTANFSAGRYTLSFTAAQRAQYSYGAEVVQVLIDGSAVSSFTPASTSFETDTTASFTVTAGVHTVTIQGVDPLNINRTALLDNIAIQGNSKGRAILRGPAILRRRGRLTIFEKSKRRCGRQSYGQLRTADCHNQCRVLCLQRQ